VARPAVLVIAATDSSGGAGLTRDVRVLSDFSVDALCVVTAVTAQSDKKVTAVHHIPPDVIRAQIAAALATRQVGAIKVGMLGNRATVEAVVEGLKASLSARGGPGPGESVASGLPPVGASLRERRFHAIPVVVDPVLVSTSGGVLLDAGGRAALLEALFPLATLVTPNVPEAAALLGEALAKDEGELVQQGLRLLGFGSRAILLKGGHRCAGGSGGRDAEEAVDLLISADGAAADGRPSDHSAVERLVAKRVEGASRGTGCALASAIAAGLAGGKPLNEACRAAKNYVLGMLTPVS
jgi:hydroxymethylpyrimidine/phosphomethylpyrimidine kinase